MKSINEKPHELTLKPMRSKVCKLAIPIAIQSALGAFLGLTDVLMVSDFGPEATAAVGTASKWVFVALMISAGLCTATGTLVAQYWGTKDTASCKQVLLIALSTGFKILIPISLLITFSAEWVMLLQTSDSQVIELGKQYLWFTAPILLLTLLISIVETSLRSSDEVILPLVIGVSIIFVNIGLNYCFISGGLGFPALGVLGAAIATTLARFIQILILVLVLYSRKHWLFKHYPVKASLALTERFQFLARPAIANTVFWSLGTLCYQVIFGHMGTIELAVFSMMGPFEGVCYSLFFGVSVACSVILGQCLGRGHFDVAVGITEFFIKVILCMGVLASILLLVNNSLLLSLLNLDSVDLIEHARPAVYLLGATIWLRMLNLMLINGVLRAGGENKFCLKMDMIAMWFVGIPLVAFAAFVLKWPFSWVLALMTVEEIVKFILCIRRYGKRHWLRTLTV